MRKPRYAYGVIKFAREPDWRLGAGQRGRTRCGDGVREQRVGRTYAQGFILYAPDGYMSAQLQGLARAPFAEGDLLRGSPAEYIAAGSSYIAYSGRFFVDEAKRSLSHEMAVSFFPNWVGQRQVRLVEVDGERLQLSTDGPQRFNGTLKTATIHWHRARPNL